MKKIYFSILSGFIFLFGTAQTFSVSPNAVIQNNNCTTVPIPVTGLPTTMDTTTFGLCSVSVDIAHSYDGDLDLWLVAPNGDSIRLANNNGGSGFHYTNTVFVMTAPKPASAHFLILSVVPATGPAEETIGFLSRVLPSITLKSFM